MIKVTVTTRRRTDQTSDVLMKHDGDDPVIAGTIFKNFHGIWTGVVGFDQFTSIRKSDVVLEMCRLAGPRHFTGAVYAYGARRIEVRN